MQGASPHTPVIESPCFSCRFWLAVCQGSGSISLREISPCSLDSRHSVLSCGYAANGKLMYHQPPVDASPLYGQNRRRCWLLLGSLCRAFPPAPPAAPKADVASPLKERNGIKPHTWRWRFARKGKYNRLGLDGGHGLRWFRKGQVMNLPLCLSGERKSFCGAGAFFQSPLLGSRPQTAAKPHSLSPLQGQVSISQKWYNLLHHF